MFNEKTPQLLTLTNLGMRLCSCAIWNSYVHKSDMSYAGATLWLATYVGYVCVWKGEAFVSR